MCVFDYTHMHKRVQEKNTKWSKVRPKVLIILKVIEGEVNIID